MTSPTIPGHDAASADVAVTRAIDALELLSSDARLAAVLRRQARSSQSSTTECAAAA